MEKDGSALRKWCLEQAFITRDKADVPHMDVVNVATEYYMFIEGGVANMPHPLWPERDAQAVRRMYGGTVE